MQPLVVAQKDFNVQKIIWHLHCLINTLGPTRCWHLWIYVVSVQCNKINVEYI